MIPVCASYYLGKGYASHGGDFCCGKRMAPLLRLGDWIRDSQFPCLAKAARHGAPQVVWWKAQTGELRSAGPPMAAVPTSAT